MSADRPSAPVTDNPPSAPQPSQDKSAPQPRDNRSDLEHNREVMTRPPMQRRYDSSADTPQAPSGRAADRTRDDAATASTPDKRPAFYDARGDLEHSREAIRRPPMQRQDSPAGASGTTHHSASDAPATGTNSNTERTGENGKRLVASETAAAGAAGNTERVTSAPADNKGLARPQPEAEPRSSAEGTSSPPLPQRGRDEGSRSPDQAGPAAERPNPAERSAPHGHDAGVATSDSPQAATPDARHEPARDEKEKAHDQPGKQASQEPAETGRAALTETAPASPQEQPAPDTRPGDASAAYGSGGADSAKEPISADPGRDASDRWPPPPEDVEHARSLYREYRDELRATGQDDSWSKGTNVVGDKPDKSPGDISDLPPSGKALLEIEDSDDPGPEKFSSVLYKGLGDADDAVNHTATSLQELFERPAPPTGHAETAADSGPQFVPQHTGYGTIDAGSGAELGLVMGIIATQGAKWLWHRVSSRGGTADGDHR